MNIIQALEDIEAAPQGNARLEVLRAKDSLELRNILQFALSPDITFGIKQFPKVVREFGDGFSESDWYNGLIYLLGLLAQRTVTGFAAQDAVVNFLSECNEKQIKWSERILKQDLRINVGAKDVNNALGEKVIYLFEVPLATDYKKCKPKDFVGQFSAQAKLDGGRCVAILPPNGGPVRLLSRTGKGWENFESIARILQIYNNERWCPFTLYLDGEVVSIVNGQIDFQSIQKTMHRKDGVEVGELRYIVFDAAGVDEWKNPKIQYMDRLNNARDYVEDIASPKVQLVPVLQTLKNPTLDLIKTLCDSAVESGYEGLILRRLDCPTENKRGKKLLKVKTFQDAEAVITGTMEGAGKLVGTLGALQCVTEDGNRFEIGSGFSDAVRAELWANREELVGQTVNYKYFELTNDGIPRFPIHRGIRCKDDL